MGIVAQHRDGVRRHHTILMLGVAFAIATALAVVFTVQMFISYRYVGDARRLSDVFVYQAINWWSWALLTPVVIAAANRLPLDRRPLVSSCVAQLAFGTVIVLLHAVLIAAVLPTLYWPISWAPFRDVLLGQVNKNLAVNGLVYPMIAGLGFMTRVRRPIEPAPTAKSNGLYQDRIAFRTDGRLVIISVDDIERVDASDNYVLIHIGSEQHRVRATISAMEERLDPRRFVRIHRSTIVALSGVTEVRPWFRGELLVLMRDGKRFKVSRTYRERLLSLMPRTV